MKFFDCTYGTPSITEAEKLDEFLLDNIISYSKRCELGYYVFDISVDEDNFKYLSDFLINLL